MKPYGKPRFKDYSEPPPRTDKINWKSKARNAWKKLVRKLLNERS
jgi:hypothetical protein